MLSPSPTAAIFVFSSSLIDLYNARHVNVVVQMSSVALSLVRSTERAWPDGSSNASSKAPFNSTRLRSPQIGCVSWKDRLAASFGLTFAVRPETDPANRHNRRALIYTPDCARVHSEVYGDGAELLPR